MRFTSLLLIKIEVGSVQAGMTVVAKFTFTAALAEGQYTVTAGVANEGSLDGQFKESLVRVQNARSFTVLRNFDSIRWAGAYNLSPTCEITNQN